MCIFEMFPLDGFRKIVDAAGGGLKHEKDEWEFFHQYFQQGKPNLLQQIKRKVYPECY